MTAETPTFESPPIVEFVLGIQFDALAGLSSAHYGQFWDVIGRDDWTGPRDQPPIQEAFERFDRKPIAAELKLQLESTPPLPRLTLISANEERDRLIQFQPTRLHLNWRSVKAKSSYPSYKALIVEFEKAVGQLHRFCENIGIAPPQINQWEITYVDRFPRGELWESPSDWGKILPGLFPNEEPATADGLKMDGRALQWAFEITPKLGRLHVNTSVTRGPDPSDEALMLTLTSRGPLHSGETPTYRDGLDLGHRTSVNQFLALVDDDLRKDWGEKDK
ncbi:TIGR04255 family protein [Allorhodopirellula heiligendammensis]|uniref:TIGR04255 family protein n=1 Tax=Allorhodopirellula heiligendammensis TaxID=2714739 RepID=A0A5C6C002_9BACT|nr:TIGR04255 family protein [Allorhodopirellula heiligendammensis]TWU16961.1 hypothetical protein Poly21_41700 [Allorhodopirellula heiligendammensis]